MKALVWRALGGAGAGGGWVARAYLFRADRRSRIAGLPGFGGGPLGRVCIDTLSSVRYSFRTFDIDAPPIAALWLGDEGGQDASVQPVDASLRDGGAESDLPQGDA